MTLAIAGCVPSGYTLVSEAPFGNDRTIQKWTLTENGLTVITLVDPSAPVFAYHTWFRVGSRYEREGKTGIAHLFEHMMFKATSHLKDGELDKIMERRGAQTNAATWVDWTYYHEALPATGDNLETTTRLEADRMVNLLLNPTQLEAERDVVMNERRYRVDDDPMGRMYETLYHLALGGHPYGWPTIGWMTDIEAITLEDCQVFYKAYYSPNNAVVVVVGNVDRDQTLALIRKYYGPLKAQQLPKAPAPKPVVVSAVRRKTLALSVSTERLLIGYVGAGIADPDLPALDVAVEILFGSDSARLHRRLVTELEWASSVEGWAAHFAWPGLVEIAVAAKSGHTAAEIEGVVLEELARLGAEGPSEEELEKARNQLEITVYRSSYSANAVAGRLGDFEVTAGDYREFGAAVERVRHVTAADVSRAVTRFFRPDGRSVVVAKPAKKSSGHDGAGPDEAGPDEAGPDEAGPDEAGPDEAGPDEAGPDEAGHNAKGQGE